MYSVFDLYTLKSKNIDIQRDTIEHLTNFFVKICADEINELVSLTENGLFSLGDEDPNKVIQYCLFAIYAADVATAMYPKFREYYINNVCSLAKEYNLNYEKIVYLSRFAEELNSYLEKKQIVK